MIRDEKELVSLLSDDRDMYYVALIFLSILSQQTSYSNIAELSLILNKDSFLNIVDVYGGKVIYIPTRKEILSAFKAVLVYYYVEVDGLSISDAVERADASDMRQRISARLPFIREVMSELKIPTVKDGEDY